MIQPGPIDGLAEALPATAEDSDPSLRGTLPERRAHARRDLSLPGRWHADGRWLLVSIESLSLGGAMLCTQVPLAVESRGHLTLDELDDPIAATVRWARGSSAGVRFDLRGSQAARLDALMRRCVDKSLLAMPCQPAGAGSGGP